MKRIWTLNYEFAGARINCYVMAVLGDLYVFALLRFDLYKKQHMYYKSYYFCH